MKTTSQCLGRGGRLKRPLAVLLLLVGLLPVSAHASIFKGETLDKVADILTWVVLIVAPIVAITVFLIIHILPEKIAERKHHPQTKAIQCLCLLSLVFGGILWPLAWLWAYTKPVLHKLAYGTEETPREGAVPVVAPEGSPDELRQLRERVVELEKRMPLNRPTEGGR